VKWHGEKWSEESSYREQGVGGGQVRMSGWIIFKEADTGSELPKTLLDRKSLSHRRPTSKTLWMTVRVRVRVQRKMLTGRKKTIYRWNGDDGNELIDCPPVKNQPTGRLCSRSLWPSCGRSNGRRAVFDSHVKVAVYVVSIIQDCSTKWTAMLLL